MHNIPTYQLTIRGLMFLLFCILSVNVSGQTFGEEDRIKMTREAKNCVNEYFTDLNNITSDDEDLRKYRDEDINSAIEKYFFSSATYIYNNLLDIKERDAKNDSLRIREYLENAHNYYPKGVKFDWTSSPNSPCPESETRENMRYFVVVVKVYETIKGVYKFNNELRTHKDSLEVYVQFVIKQDRPKLVLDAPKIYRITKYTDAKCPAPKLLEDKKKKPFQFPDDDGEERDILRRRAKNFVQDYAITLDIIGNPHFNEQFNTLDYFESENTQVANDILPYTLPPVLNADEYLHHIERWYQNGATFKYKRIQAINVLAEFDYVNVEVQVNRLLRSEGVGGRDRHRQRLSILVKFPVVRKTNENDDNMVVGIERSTPRIASITALPPRVNPNHYLAVGMQVLTANYFGDIAPNSRILSTDFRRTNPAWGIYLLRKVTEHWYIKANFMAATLSGDDVSGSDYDDASDKYRYVRNLHFRNRIREFTINGIYEFYKNTGKYYSRHALNPYITFGIGFFRNKPEARLPMSGDNITTPWISLRQLGTEGQGRQGYRNLYAVMQPVIPIGIGVRYKVSRRIDLNFEISGRFTFTDFIDDVSGNYPDYDDFENNNLAISMSNRTMERTNAFNKENRAVGLDYFLSTGGQNISYTGANGRVYNTVNGYGRKGEKRGTSGNRDYYILAGFHVHYLLNVGPQASAKKASETKLKYEFDK